MRKYILLFLLAVVSLAAEAQNVEPNRMVVSNKQGRYHSYNISDIDTVGFYRINGRVAADVKVNKFAKGQGAESDTLWLNIKKSAACSTYKICTLPTNTANMLNTDLICATYMEENGKSATYFDDYTNAQMTGFEERFKDNTSYTVLTVGYDNLGTACEASKAEFTTPAAQLVGNPDVTYEFTEITPTSLTCKFTPNDDVKAYGICLFDYRGGAQDQFEQFGPMFGFDNIGDMIRQYSYYDREGEYVKTWDGLIPGHEYEIGIQAWDVKETYAPVIYAYATTATQGGTGEAKVDITIGEFGQENGNYFQWVKFTPNDQTMVYHAAIFNKYVDGKEKTDAEIDEYLGSDSNPNYPPGMEDPYWDLVKEDNDRWGLEPNTTYFAAAKAKNANGEYGPLTKVEFTTPSAANAPAKKAAGQPARIVKNTKDNIPTMVVPQLMKKSVKKAGIQLVEK